MSGKHKHPASSPAPAQTAVTASPATTPKSPRAQSPAPTKSRIGDTLMEHGALSPEQLNKALAQQNMTGAMLGELLVEQGVVSSATLIDVLSKSLGIRGVVLRHGLIDSAVFKLVGEEEATRLCALPLF